MYSNILVLAVLCAQKAAEAHYTSAATHHQSSSVSSFAFAQIKPAKINIPFWQVLEFHAFGAVDMEVTLVEGGEGADGVHHVAYAAGLVA